MKFIVKIWNIFCSLTELVLNPKKNVFHYCHTTSKQKYFSTIVKNNLCKICFVNSVNLIKICKNWKATGMLTPTNMNCFVIEILIFFYQRSNLEGFQCFAQSKMVSTSLLNLISIWNGDISNPDKQR